MFIYTRTYFFLLFVSVAVGFSCNNSVSKPVEKDIVQEPEHFSEHLSDNINKICLSLHNERNKINDSVQLAYPGWVSSFYASNGFSPVWSRNKQWLPLADSLIEFAGKSMYLGLFPSDYHPGFFRTLQHQFRSDSTEMKNAAAWARADVVLTDVFFQLGRHIKLGHFPSDSVSVNGRDSIYGSDFFIQLLKESLNAPSLSSALLALEPSHYQFKLIKSKLKEYIDSNNFKRFTYIFYPYKDTASFFRQVQTRLKEQGLVKQEMDRPDSINLKPVVAAYQRTLKLKQDSILTESLIQSLNKTAWEKFKVFIINLDRYRQLPDSMPARYALVNLPAYELEVHDSDSVVIVSKVIVGHPKTRSPELNSEIFQFITMPYWNVPNSIVIKEMLSKIIANPAYLAKNDYAVLNSRGEVLDPANIDWKKYKNKKGVPFLIRQNPGDDNSLGVIKFNFNNRFSVYMHDTNARGLFSRKQRALSHGCIRVQNWQGLAEFLCRGDSITVKKTEGGYQRMELVLDTINAWINREERHYYTIKKRLPLFIRYFTCRVNAEGNIEFFDDIYKEDKQLRERYLVNKIVR